jgi:hypothetical protein
MLSPLQLIDAIAAIAHPTLVDSGSPERDPDVVPRKAELSWCNIMVVEKTKSNVLRDTFQITEVAVGQANFFSHSLDRWIGVGGCPPLHLD